MKSSLRYECLDLSREIVVRRNTLSTDRVAIIVRHDPKYYSRVDISLGEAKKMKKVLGQIIKQMESEGVR